MLNTNVKLIGLHQQKPTDLRIDGWKHSWKTNSKNTFWNNSLKSNLKTRAHKSKFKGQIDGGTTVEKGGATNGGDEYSELFNTG